MRPRYLEVEGLQSFKEAQSIDFDRLGETGLFGIFGPTGSGKSTILDALTLALYGNVQRANRGTQGIINMAASSVRVSFTFDLTKAKERKTYRVERQYRRKKDSENFIESRVARLIEVNPAGEVVLADKLGEVNDAVIELIGLQFDDFTRSVVLPQNKFQEFLLSPKGDKTKMLERIFYLEEYGKELMEKVNRKLSRVRNRLSGIEGSLAMLGDISEASLEEAKNALEESAEQRKGIDEALQASEAEYETAREVWELTSELQEARQLQEGLSARSAETNELKSRCNNALAAESLSDRITELERTEGELRETEEELQRLAATLMELGTELERNETELARATKSRQEELPRLIEHRTRLEKAREAKQELLEMEKVLSKLRSEYVEIKKKVDDQEQGISVQKVRLETLLAELSAKKARTESLKIEAGYREKVQKGAALEEELIRSKGTRDQQMSRYDVLKAAINNQEQELQSLDKRGQELDAAMQGAERSWEEHKNLRKWDRNDILKSETRYYSIKSVTDSMKQKSRDIEQLEARLVDYAKQLSYLAANIGELEAGRARKQTELEEEKRKLADKQGELEENSAFMLSQRLKDNEPCPVCGSTSHPKPAVHTESVEMSVVEEEIRQARARVEKLELEHRALENEGIKLAEQHNNLSSQREALENELGTKRAENKELSQELPEDFRELSIALTEERLQKLTAEKQERLKLVEKWEKELSALEESQKKAVESYNRYQVESSGKRSQLEANRKHLEELQKACTEAEEDYGRKESEHAGMCLSLGISNIGSELQRLKENDLEAEGLDRELQLIEVSIAGLRKDIEKSEEQRKQEQEKLSENIAEGRGYKYRKEEKEKEIHDLLGEKDINEELIRTAGEIELLEKGEQKAAEAVASIRGRHEQTVKDKTVHEKQRDIYKTKLEKDVSRLSRELAEKGFESIDQVRRSIIPPDKLAEQQQALREYEETVNNIRIHIGVIEKKLSGRSITEEQWKNTSDRYQELKLAKENSIAAYESARNRYETLRGNFEKWVILNREFLEHSRKKGHLETFKNLLKGNGFIEYISEERLRYIAREASETLGTLTRHRYALELDPENGFVIRDDANGGMRRLVTTLSGGETFLTSLALALALSSQIQLKGQSPLEFFFLDEGFGTLDSSLLDTVIDSLERLSTKERVIGLISHVPEMKARITRRLVVEAPVVNGAGSRVYMEKA